MIKIYNISKYIVLASVFLLTQFALLSAPPEQYLPENGEDCVSLDATFQWSKINDAAHYMIIISENADFSDTLRKNLNLQDSSYSYMLPEFSTKYYWKVGVHIIGEEDQYSAGFELTTKHAPPMTLEPIEGSNCLEFAQLFKWNATENASEYRVMISETPNFDKVVVDTTLPDTSGTFTVKSYFQTHYWRVQSKVASCTSDWSENKSFTTIVGPPNTAQYIPADSAKGVPPNMTFIWPSTPGAQEYKFQLSDDSEFSNLLLDFTLLKEVTSFDHLNEEKNKRYWWRMSTIGAGCNSEWSEPVTYITGYEAANGVSPGDTVPCVNLETQFVWNKVPMATTYRIQASKTETFNNDQDILFEANSISDTMVIGNVQNASSRIYWRVRAEDNENYGEWSAVKSYFTTSDSPISKFPEEGDIEIPRGATFAWEPIGQSQHFQIQVAFDEDFTEIDIDSTNILDKTIELILSKYNTQYYFRVRSFYNGCFSAWSQVTSFKSIQGFPNLIYPADTEENITTDVLLDWSVVPTANNYDFRIALDTTFEGSFGQNGVLSNNFLQSNLQPNTKYYWKVRSNDKWGTSPWSDIFEFTTGDESTDVPILIYPENNSVKIPVDGEIYWRKSQNANSYLLDVATDRKFENIVISQHTLTDTIYKYKELDNFTEYHYRVASRNATTTSKFTTSRKFRTIALAPSDMALAISPANGEDKVQYNNQILQWTKVARTDIGLSSESGYELLLSKSQDFSDTVKYYEKSYNENQKLNDLLEPSTTYFWKVRGWNEAGFGPWSDGFSFTTDIATSVAIGEEHNFNTSIVPNPVSNNAELRFTLDKPTKVNFVIVDQLGKEIFRLNNLDGSQNENIIPLNFENLSNGKYIFNIQVGNKHQTGKLIISR